jgi:hypothetical protein
VTTGMDKAGADVSRWVIYALLSTLTVAIGIVCLAVDWRDVGISLLSGGIASALFLVQKVVDDLSQRGDRAAGTAAMNELSRLIQEHEIKLDGIRRALTSIAAHVDDGADNRVTMARHLTVESTQVIDQLGEAETVELDGVGISLKQLLVDHETTFTTRQNLRVRLIILDPRSALFDAAVAHEGRDAAVMREQVKYVLAAAGRIVRKRREAGWDSGIEVRLFDGIMTTTGIRVADTWFFRPRFANESNSIQFFFERYDSTAPECCRMLNAHFTTLWEKARPARGGMALSRRSAGTADG